MTEAATAAAFEALCRVEVALRQSERQEANQKRVLDLLTTIAETLEATKCTANETGAETASPLHLASTPTPECSATIAHGQMASAELGLILHALSRLQHSVSAALMRLSLRAQTVGEGVLQLSAALRSRAAAVGGLIEEQYQQCVQETASLAVLSTAVHLGSVDEDYTALQEKQATESNILMPPIPSCSSFMQAALKKDEEALSAAICHSADVYQSAAETTCRLLRSTLVETLSSQRWFPSAEVCQLRRNVRSSWHCEIRKVALRRQEAQKIKWRRHERMADAVTEGEWS